MAPAVRRATLAVHEAAECAASATLLAAEPIDLVVPFAVAADACARRRVPALAAAQMSFAKPFSPANPFDS